MATVTLELAVKRSTALDAALRAAEATDRARTALARRDSACARANLEIVADELERILCSARGRR